MKLYILEKKSKNNAKKFGSIIFFYYLCNKKLNQKHTTMESTKMTLDQEMALWSERSSDEFGTILTKIVKAEKATYGYCTEYLDELKAEYCLDGNRKYTYKKIENVLTNYDIIPEDKKVVGLMRKLNNIANL